MRLKRGSIKRGSIPLRRKIVLLGVRRDPKVGVSLFKPLKEEDLTCACMARIQSSNNVQNDFLE